MAGSSLALRSFLLATIFWLKGEGWTEFITNSDAGSFLAVAKVIYRIKPPSSLTLYDARVFPGWPLLFGWAFKVGLPDPVMLAISCALAALAPVLFFRLTGQRTLAWYLVYFPPAWLLASTHPVSEPAYLVVILLGLLALKGGRPVLSGFLGGALVVLRAFGVAWSGALLVGLVAGRRRLDRAAVGFIACAAIPVAGLFLLNWRIFGDPLLQLHVYAQPLAQLNISASLAAGLHNPSGHWGWPFANLIMTPWRIHVPLWKTLYIYSHVPVVLLLAREAWGVLRRPAAAEAWQLALACGYLGNAALILCTGPYWGFESFDRYFVWGLPGALWLARRWLGDQPRWHWLLFPASVALCLRSIMSHLTG